jgi:hypothetical protein
MPEIENAKPSNWFLRASAIACIFIFLVTAFRAGWTRSETDFPNYYTAAAATLKGQPLRNFYDWTWFQRQMNYAGFEHQLGAYTPQTPLTMLPFLPLAKFPPQIAKRVWLVCNLVFLSATVVLLASVTKFPAEKITFLAFCGYGSLYTNFLYGQYYVFLLFLLTLAYYLLQLNLSSTSGFLSGITFGLKLYAGPLLLYFAAKKNWKALVGMSLSLLLVAAISIGLFGWKDSVYYATQVLPRSLEGSSVDPYHRGSPTISAFLRRSFVPEAELNPHPLLNSPQTFFFLRSFIGIGLLVTITLCVAVSRESIKKDFAWFILGIFLLSTSIASYSFILLLLPVALLLDDSPRVDRAVIFVFFVLLANPLPSRLDLFFPKLWLLVFLFLCVGRSYFRAIKMLRMVLAVAAIMVMALLSAHRQLQNYLAEPVQHFEQIAIEPAALFSSFPSVTKFGIFYQSMGTDRYVLKWLHDGQTEMLSFPGQALTPEALIDGKIRFELVANAHSTIMEFDPATRQSHSVAAAADSLEREMSKISPDGLWMAFVPPSQQPRQIWLRSVTTGAASQLTGGNCNSMHPDWSLDSGSIVFASDCGRAFGLPALYRAQIPKH